MWLSDIFSINSLIRRDDDKELFQSEAYHNFVLVFIWVRVSAGFIAIVWPI